MRWKPAVTVAAIIERQQHFLLVDEWAGGRRCFNQPAGHLEPGESLLQAVVRETREETGCLFEPQALIGIYQWQARGEGKSFLRFTFCGQAGAPAAGAVLDEGIVGTRWCSRQEILEAQLPLRTPLIARSVRDYLAGRRFPLEVIDDER
ncbi:MAG: NUDIX hydrolase [Pseudomonadota bacterium]|nr:NUDIX hydrolase [Pseudomonadota bacterium]HJO36905.1 NUDIX hydrolase [Gammaproteobacteria bacterium]